MAIEKIIHFTIPEKSSAKQSEVIERARSLHPTWEVKVWQDPIKPDDFLLERYWPKVNSGAQLADLVRLDVLYRFGGVYVDSDLKLLKPLDDLVEHYEFFVSSEDGVNLTNALIGAKKNSPVIRDLIGRLVGTEPDWTLAPNVTTGPVFFSDQLKWRKEITVLPRETFYTYNWYSTETRSNHRQSYGEHMWEGSWTPQNHSGHVEQSRKAGRDVSRGIGRTVKPLIKKAILAGFNTWHRVQNHDPRKKAESKFYACAPELVVETVHGFRIVVDGRDVSLTPELVFNGYYELPEQNFLNEVVKGGDWVIDVGANVGSFSLLAAQRVGPFGRVFAFEPNPRPAELMAKSLVMNWTHERVVQRPVAVGRASGEVGLTFIPGRLGDAQVGQETITGSTFSESLRSLAHEQQTTLRVQSRALDDEFPVDVPIKVLKIDVEGYEGQVLAGAERLLRERCIDYIIMELVEEVAGSRWQEVLVEVKKAMGYGYKINTLTSDGKLTPQQNLEATLRARQRNIVLAAENQYYSA